MLLPIIFPTPISEYFFRIAKVDVINSGNEVPIATIETPTIRSDRPNNLADITTLSTVSKEPT